jgi:hypothetical protein
MEPLRTDGNRQPADLEKEIAKPHGKHFATITAKLAAKLFCRVEREKTACLARADLAFEKFLKRMRNEAVEVRLDYVGQNASQQRKVELNGPKERSDSHKNVFVPHGTRLCSLFS